MVDKNRITLLDVGDREYGECLLVESGGRRILIDGAHQGDHDDDAPYIGISRQLRELTNSEIVPIDLLVVSHAHADHVGCLPELVSGGVIKAEWALVPDPDISWGRPIGTPAPTLPDEVGAALAGTREEDPSLETLLDDARLAVFLADAVTLETRYGTLIADLEAAGTTVVRHGRREDAPLLAAFGEIGLEIIGPSIDQLSLTAALIGQAMDAIAIDAFQLADALPDGDDRHLALYRSLRDGTGVDAAKSRPGDLVNLQSLNLAISVGGRRSFFGGDMELADASTGNSLLKAEIAALRGRIRTRGPFAYAQLGHHGSANATSASTLEDLGAPSLVGMSAGRASDKHPSGEVLQTLAMGQQQWARTDRNGQVKIEPTGTTGWTVQPSRGVVSDPTPAGADAQVVAGSRPRAEAGASPVLGAVSLGSSTATSVGEVKTMTQTSSGVEVSVRTSRPVRVTIAFEDGPTTSTGVEGGSVGRLAAPLPDFVALGAGRQLPRLMYVTDPGRLAANVGVTEADLVMSALRAAPGRVVEVDGGRQSSEIRQTLAPSLADFEGIVLVGGYDVIPSDVVDTLPPALAGSIARQGDADQFVVWTDDLYAQRKGAVSLPISRVPDGHSAGLLFQTLSATGSTPSTASGVRNVNRPFADSVYEALSGRAALLVSEPILAADARGRLGGDAVYLMLHGYWRDAKRLWGESAGEFPEAFNLSSVSARPGGVAFSGACWGALIVDVQAMRYSSNVPLGSRGPAESIALAYLAGGSRAFVGCTGSHYSPSAPPYRSAGAPIHYSFFTYLASGLAPAIALAQAKRDYVAAMPHTPDSPGALAIEHKLVWQFTCLGLGW